MAKLSGLSLSMIANMEAGKMNPSYESVRRLESAINALTEQHAPRARELMAKRVVAVAPTDAVARARQLMDEHDFSQLPVMNGDICVGSVSTSILFERVVAGTSIDELSAKSVASIMGPAFPTVSLDAPTRALCALLAHVPMVMVVDRGEVQGVVSKSDLW